MKRLLKLLRGRGGMTMVELMVAMLTFAILSTAVASILHPTLTAYANANSQAEINTLLDNLAEAVLNDASKACAMEVTDTDITIRSELLTSRYGVNGEGHLYRGQDDTLVLPKEFYKKKTIKMEFLKANSDGTAGKQLKGNFDQNSKLSFFLRLTILENGSEMASRSYAVKPLGLNQYRTA